MELKKQLNHYDEREFSAFVHAIWNVEVDQSHHDALIAHFDNIVGHPAGSDLLFYSDAWVSGNPNSPSYILAKIKAWHRRNGRAAFKDQVLPPSPSVRQTLSPEQRVLQNSTRNLQRARDLAAKIQVGERDFKHKAAQLEKALVPVPDTGAPARQLADSVSVLHTLEAAQHQAKRALGVLERLQMSVKFDLDAARRDVKSPFFKPAIQAVVLREMEAASEQYGVALAAAQSWHAPLYARGVALIERLETRVSTLARATNSGPGYTPMMLNASARTANLHPQLLTARGLIRDVAQHQRSLVRTFISAVAELEWQGASLEDEHTGTYADVMEFVLSTPSDDPRFAFTVPLTAISDSEPIDWQTLASSHAEVQLPLRLCSMVKDATSGSVTGVKPATQYIHVAMTLTQGSVVSSHVRVRPAQWDASRQLYTFTGEGEVPVTVAWHAMRPAYANEDHSRPPSVGYLNIPKVPRIEAYSDLEHVQFDDYVVVFPPGSGLAPLYLMFRDRRDL